MGCGGAREAVGTEKAAKFGWADVKCEQLKALSCNSRQLKALRCPEVSVSTKYE